MLLIVCVVTNDAVYRLSVESIKAKVEEATKLKKQLEAKIESIHQESRNSVDRLNDIREQLAQRDITKRNISDNIKYREQLNAIKTLEAKIKEKERAISAVMNVSDMEDDIDKLEKDVEGSKSQVKALHLLNKYSLFVQRDRLVGSRATYAEQVRIHEKELAKPNYKNVDEDYRKILIQAKVSMYLAIVAECTHSADYWDG